MRDDDNEVRRRLRGAAQAHRPDRERMRARVEQGMAAGPRPERQSKASRGAGASWLRVVTATAAAAGVCAVGGYGVASALRADEAGRSSVATTATPDTPPPAASEREHDPAPPTRRPSGTPATPPASGPPESARPPSGGASSRPADPPRTSTEVPTAELLWADGSVDPGSSEYWSQGEITLKARKPLTSLTVELRVDGAAKVEDTGNWRSLPEEDFDVTVGEREGFLVYRWTLKAGRTVPVGEHTFAGQYNHPDGKRDAHGDRYRIAAGAKGERTQWKGDFAPQED
ncbi:hypothetical protein [Streptomyces sp. NRRL S-1521]|uniref:hypothetical protein n=1 Tax=Streptomyces sp. NRRL S-1521 TaxID=1609100 RepID=UPI0007493D5A|nr:hypothetical protein [Streptomyces sp. NRRL S-1521]KUL50849.1 hypothetical protein ADL30_28755 [Streptomyces sp. NRRL S-1521]